MNDIRPTRTTPVRIHYLTPFLVMVMLLVQGLMLTPLVTAQAQDRQDRSTVEREIHVEFVPGAVTLPEGQTQVAPQELTIEAPALQDLFQQIEVEKIAKTFPQFDRADTTAVTRTGDLVRLADVSQVFTLRLPSEAGIERIVERLDELPQVVFAERNGGATTHVLATRQATPNDDFFGPNGEQWSLLNNGQDGGNNDADIDAPEAWDITTGSSNVTIGIIDSGVESGHPDLSGKVSGDATFNAHGTHVAGIAAAKTDNNEGIAGVDWNAQIYNKAPIGSAGGDSGLFNDIMDALQVGNADILNNSYSLCEPGTCNDPAAPPEPRYSSLVQRAFANAYRMNVVSVASMGNSSDERKYYPSGFDQRALIAVGATDRNDNLTSFSTTGDHIDVAAPGEDIMSTVTFGARYAEFSGTSMAAPHVSGIAGLLLAENPNLYNDDIEQIIRLSAEDIDDSDPATGPGFDKGTGTGRVNARKALEYLQTPYTIEHWTAQGGTSVESWDFVGTFYDLPGAPNGNYVGKTHRVRTTVSFPESFSSIEDAWGRGVPSTGYSAATSNFSVPYCRVVSHTATSVTLETFVHNVSRIDGSYSGWYPVRPQNTECAYTVLGELGPSPLEVTLSGPSTVNSGQSGTWTADVEGGEGSTSYSWGVREPGSINWTQKFCSGPSCSHTFSNFDDQIRDGAVRVSVTKGSETVQASQTVFVSPDCADNVFLCPATQIASISSFEAEPQGESAQLAWSTTGSMGEGAFLVQHRADSTAAWSDLETVSASDMATADSTDAPAYRVDTNALAPGTHQFRLQWTAGGETTLLSDVVEAEITLSDPYRLRAYPNPAGAQMTVESVVQERQHVRVQIYDVLGRRVTTVYDGPMAPNEVKRFTVQPGADGLSSGTYFLRMTGEQFQTTTRISVVR